MKRKVTRCVERRDTMPHELAGLPVCPECEGIHHLEVPPAAMDARVNQAVPIQCDVCGWSGEYVFRRSRLEGYKLMPVKG